jgi:hypothetical protein
MVDLCRLIWCVMAGMFRPRVALHAEILVLRHQLNVLRRKLPKRLVFKNIDRLVLIALYRLAPNVLDALKFLKPATVIAWHRGGFRAYWRWKSRPHGGRPSASAEIRRLIHEMSIANPLWGAPRVHGELLKLGIDVGQTTVAKYMGKRRTPPSQGWKTFIRNHANDIVAIDMFVAHDLVPTAIRASDFAACSPGAAVVGGNSPSERPMDRAATDRSVRLEGNAAISHPRSRSRLWRGLHSACWGDGHSRPTDLGALAMAERIRGEAYRFDPAGLP